MKFSNSEEFDPQEIVDWAKWQAQEAASETDHESAVEAMRSVVDAFMTSGLLDVEHLSESPTASFEAAAHTLYICHLIPLLFPGAYKVAEQHVGIEHKIEDDKDDIIESLHRSFDL